MISLAGDRRPLKRLGIELCPLGFGAWGIGGRYVGSSTPIDGREALLAYLEAGGNFIDTALAYGESEKTVGTVLKEFGGRDPVYVATKTKSGETADTVGRIREDLETSLKNLRRDCVDLYYLHMPPEDPGVIDSALAEMEALKKEGKIRGIGVSVKGPAVTDSTVSLCRAYTDSGRVDAIQLVYSILRQKNLKAIEYAAARGVGIVVRTSMESGFLTGKFPPGIRFPRDDHRSRWNGSVDGILRAVEKVKERYVKPPYDDIGKLAIRFALAPEGVTSVIVGAKNGMQQRANVASLLLESPEEAVLSSLKEEFGEFTESCNPAE